jgi:hypothetical protein
LNLKEFGINVFHLVKKYLNNDLMKGTIDNLEKIEISSKIVVSSSKNLRIRLMG